jgi:hypothetical protein
VTHRSRSPWSTSLGVALLVGTASSGCVFVHDDHHDGVPDPDPEIIAVGIDEGASLEADPGAGVGVFVEYQGGGDYRIWTTCDSEVTGYSCAFDLFLTADSLRVSDTEDLEGFDEASDLGDEVDVSLDTDVDTDGVVVTTLDGAPLRLEVWLDGAPDAEFVYWVQGGVIRQGAPSNPVDFVP